MREIKFKVYDKKTKKRVEFYNLDFGRKFISVVSGNRYFLSENLPLENFIICQYTGLKDKNGKEIYEGDILKWADKNSLSLEPEDIDTFPDIFEVVFKDGSFIAVGIDKKGKWEAPSKEFLVVGNIYKNPELLKA